MIARAPLTLLYVPADRPERVAKAFESGADTVILDLEDAVAPGAKDVARAGLQDLLRDRSSTSPMVQVRVNGSGTPWHHNDLAAVAALAPDVGVRLPKCERVDEVHAAVAAAEGRDVHLLLESALGIEQAFALACSHSRVASVTLGETDLLADLGATDDTALTWARGRVVVAAAAAGLPSPVQSVYRHHRDLEGLRESCRQGLALGFRGRTAIHPAQLAVIREVFTPSASEIERAEEILVAAEQADHVGRGALALPDGRFVDAAVVRQARAIVALRW